MTEFDSWDRIKAPPASKWPNIKERFPIGSDVRGVVIARQPFGAFIDLGDEALALTETPHLPWNPDADRVEYPPVGAELTGVVVGHRDGDRQIRVVAHDPWNEHLDR